MPAQQRLCSEPGCNNSFEPDYPDQTICTRDHDEENNAVKNTPSGKM